MAQVFLTNLPYNCTDQELREWAESRGIEVLSTRIILDLEAGVGPAFGYIEIRDASLMRPTAALLNGTSLRNNKVIAKPVQVSPIRTGLASSSAIRSICISREPDGWKFGYAKSAPVR